jgi:hypothetical protein
MGRPSACESGEQLRGERGQSLGGEAHGQLPAHEVIGPLAQLLQVGVVVEQLVDDAGDALDVRGEEVLAWDQRLAVEGGLGDDHAAVADRLEEAHPLERPGGRAVQVEQDAGGAQPVVLVDSRDEVGAGGCTHFEGRDEELARARGAGVAVGGQQRVAAGVGGAQVEHVDRAGGVLVAPPGVPGGDVAELDVRAGNPATLQLGGGGAVDRDGGGELGDELERLIEPRGAGVLGAEGDRARALARVGQARRIAVRVELMGDRHVDGLLGEGRERVEGKLDTVSGIRARVGEGDEQLGHEVAAPAGADEAEAHLPRGG